jgi:hypothetical protein
MNDHRLPRHDRPPEPWLPHPGTQEASPPPPLLLGDASPPAAPFLPRTAARPFEPPFTPGTQQLRRADASPFARFIVGLAMGRKSVALAVGLALLGPLGLFYVSLLHGVAALIVVPYAAQMLAMAVAQSTGAGPQAMVSIAVAICWLITVPWAAIAAQRHNARRGL